MIIKFDQSPEEYFRLSEAALGRKELDRAMIYGEKALRGKGTTEYRLSLAEIFLLMGRHSEAADLALEALCFGRGMRAEVYDLLSRVSGDMGCFYESLHYIAKKAHYEQDEDALDAMDEVMQELTAKEEKKEDPFFIVGKEKKEDAAVALMRASFAMNRGDYKEAIRAASEVTEDSPQYPAARNIRLRSLVKGKEDEEAIRLAEEILGADPHNAYALYVLVDKYKKREYLPLLSGVQGNRDELFYAIAAAEDADAHEIAWTVAERMIAASPYDLEGHFIAAAVALNMGDRRKSEDVLKRVFTLYPKYPARLILDGWRRLRHCHAFFQGKMPDEIVRILSRYVRKGLKSREQFLHDMLTDETYRAAVTLLIEGGERAIIGEILDRFGESQNKLLDAFFGKFLIRNGVELLVKRAILAELLFHKDKGKLPLVQSMVPIMVNCTRPEGFDAYSPELQEAYINLYSFVVCVTDGAGEGRLRDLTRRAHELGVEATPEVMGGAFLYRLLAEDLVAAGPGMRSPEDACRFVMTCVFGISRFSFAKAKKLAALLNG